MMKTNFNPSSTCVSAYMSARNFARNSANNFRRIAVLLVLLLSFAFGARAASYEFYYEATNGTKYYMANNNGTLTAVTTYNASTCVWEGESGGTFSNNGMYIDLNRNNGSISLADDNNVYALTIDKDGHLYYQRNASRFYYIYYDINSGKFLNQEAYNGSMHVSAKEVVIEQTPTQYVFYYSSNYGGAYYLAVNDARNGVTRTNTFDAETCIWTGVDVGAGVYSATVDGTTYYLRLQSSGYNYTLTITTDKDQATQWTINGAKLYSNGRYVRYNNGWTTTSTAGNSGTDVLYPITKISEGTPTTTVEYTVGNTTVSPTAAAVDYGKSQQFTANASVTKTTTTTKTDTYQHSSSTGNTIQPKPSVSSTSSETLSPTGYDWSLSSTDNLTLGSGTASTNSVTYSTASGTTKNVTLNVTAYYMDGASKKQGAAGTATITVNEKLDDPTSITANDLTLAVDEQKAISYTLTPSNAHDNIAYSGYDNTIISITDGVVKGLKAGITTVTLTAKNLNGTNSAHSATSTVTVTPKAPTIEFSLGANITATISTTETGATIYYTTDGTTPTTSSPVYTAPVSVTAGATVKAIVVVMANGTPLTSPVAEALANAESGIVGNTVFLYDLEDHNWTYYSGVNTSVDGGNYNDNYVGKLYSPNPRNVKITYNGVNGISGSATNVRVSISENESAFVYYKTLEQGNTNGEYPYQVISNPFSVRPSVGSGNSKVYYGFNGWKIISGGEYIKGYNNGQILPLDAEIVFENLPYPNVNCISADIVFETSWAQANVQTGNDITTMMNNFTGGTYETNFAVLTGTYTTQWTGNKNATITSIYPDGSNDSRNGVYTRLNNLTLNAGYTIKYEYIHINNDNSTFSMGSGTKTLYLGRGISNTASNGVCCNLIQGYNNSISSGGLTYTIKVESGIYNYLSFIKGYDGGSTSNTVTGTVAVKGVLGCDYDRAKKNNSNLKIQNHAIMGYANTNVVLLKSPKAGDEVLNVTLKSGSLNSNTTSAGTADVSQSFYIGIGGGYSPGYRVFTMEGGEMWSLAAGICQNTSTTNSILFRIKGGLIKGSIYGSAANADSYGYKKMIITGGHIKGWIAGGGNGTSANGGVTEGSSYIYVGGNSRVDSEGSNNKINSSLGGQVFGSGSGVDGSTTWGEMLYGSNVVIADNAYIERDVFGGGNFGWTDQNANIYLTGVSMSVGRVFGGANQNKGDYVNIYMTGGTIREGLYGGSNTTGTIGYNVKMQINGGQVGTSSAPANIHGGGYGQSTIVTGNVNLTLGTSDQTSEGVTVWGDVYGGSALGKVNCTVNNYNNYQYTNNTETNVTLYKGTINGSLYGGALGGSNVGTHVYGPVKVKVYGGSVKKTSADGSGGVYGANNKDGAPQSSVTVDIYGTDPAPAEGQYALYAVYGGGNQADYLYGNGYPTVTVHGCDNSIEYVYGGGNAAAVKSTNVTIWGGNVIGNVFGGGHGYKDGAGADVEGNVNVAIKGGTIKRVFGGSNSKGNISGTINLDINKDGACDMRIGEVYGGGNEAAGNAGAVTIGCTGALVEGSEGHAAHPENIGKILEGIGAVYGGANNANVTNASGITLNINSGMVANAFGGNNTGGDITGGITVNINKNANTCGWYVGNVYGAGNLAQYSGSPAVNILNGEVSGNVYGGGKGDANDHSKGQVTGNPTVTIGDKSNVGYEAIVKGDVYGGGDAGNVVGIPVVNVVNKCNTTIGNVYGGGNAADVNGTDVNIDGGTITGMVFGGGHGDKNAAPQTEANVNGNVNVDITGGTINKVFGGSNSKGNITGTIALNIEKGDESCELHITEVYGGGNEAYMDGDSKIVLGCIEALEEIYGGARNADVKGDINLTISSGHFDRVFGGNNIGGTINGSITVTIDETGCNPITIGELYGCGNQAAYTTPAGKEHPTINLISFTSIGNVFGGGLGADAVVTGNPTVNINVVEGANSERDWAYNGQTITFSDDSKVTLPIHEKGKIGAIGNVFGGGNAAAVIGNTQVNIGTVASSNADIRGNVYGGGNQANVTGQTNVVIGQ